MKIVEGDLIKMAKNGEFDVIVHGCNCFCTMGAGIAKNIKREFPDAYLVDTKTNKGDSDKLGTCTFATHGNLTIVNAYTQYKYGKEGRFVNYNAVRKCMQIIRKRFTGKRIGIPKIGAGLAGGDWSIISQIIDEELANEDVTCVIFRMEEK